MKEDIEGIIKKLEKAQELLYRGRNDEAATAVSEAQSMAIFIRDHKSN